MMDGALFLTADQSHVARRNNDGALSLSRLLVFRPFITVFDESDGCISAARSPAYVLLVCVLY